MKALAVTPLQHDSAALIDREEPSASDGSLLVEMLAVGICGTDREIIAGEYGWAPAKKKDLVIGHESLGRVLSAPNDSGFKPGDLVAGIVRRPDPVPCESCRVLEWDMCRNGLYTERGIKSRDGFCSERYRLEPEFAIHCDPALGELGVLTEPASVVAKAWEQIEKISARATFKPKRALITGAGPIGLLAALMGRQRDMEVHVVDHNDKELKANLVKSLGATYATSFDPMRGFDVAIECTGAGSLAFDVIEAAGPDSIICLSGVSSVGAKIEIDPGKVNRSLVLENAVVFGTVNARRAHYEAATISLGKASKHWLSRLITRRVPLSRWREILETSDNDIKTIIVPG